jgi:plastocyanin
VGEARTGRAGVPSTFAAPAPFATAPAAAADAPATGGAPATTGEPAGPVLPPVYSNPRAVQVRAYEFRFQLSKSSVSAGDVSVEFNLSAAEDPHDLWLVREDGTGAAHSFGETPAGAVVRTAFPLTAGRWTLFCSLTGHQAAGMRSTLTVG